VSEEADLLRRIVARPDEAGQTWLVLADWLDDRGRAGEAELIRLRCQPAYRPDLDARARHARIVELLVSGVRPCVPTWTNRSGMVFVWCPPGEYVRGSPIFEPGRYDDETPHRVTLTRGFWIGSTPVTQAQWRAVTGSSPSRSRGKEKPVESVSWDDCVAFCRSLTETDGRPYRLPTEAEWEYAARAGTQTPFFWGEGITAELVHYKGTEASYPDPRRLRKTLPVGGRPPNAWGLYDCEGNVCEWCADFANDYPRSDVTDPSMTQGGVFHIVRGGSWYFPLRRCRPADRSRYSPSSREAYIGLRVCFTPTGPEGEP
jgi:uncharacterized protein (TIGR02996 family)